MPEHRHLDPNIQYVSAPQANGGKHHCKPLTLWPVNFETFGGRFFPVCASFRPVGSQPGECHERTTLVWPDNHAIFREATTQSSSFGSGSRDSVGQNFYLNGETRTEALSSAVLPETAGLQHETKGHPPSESRVAKKKKNRDHGVDHVAVQRLCCRWQDRSQHVVTVTLSALWSPVTKSCDPGASPRSTMLDPFQLTSHTGC